MSDESKIPIGRLVSSVLVGTVHPMYQPVGGFGGSRTTYQGCVEVWVPGMWSNATHAARRTLNADDAEAYPATILIDGTPHDAIEVREPSTRVLATEIEGGWMVVVTVPSGDTVPEVELLPGEKTSADGAVHFTLPPGVAEALKEVGEQD